MILGIASLGEGRRPILERVQLWGSHTLGGVLGGAAMAAFLWLLFTPLRTLLPRDFALALVGLVAVYSVLADAGKVRFWRRRSQVPAAWYARYGPTQSYVLYGLFLGAGILTYVPYGVVYGAFAAMATLLSLPQAALGGALFGIGRTLTTGPASFYAEPVSRLLFRSPRAQARSAKLSVALTIALVAVIAAWR
jgi:hypothetical protein